MAVVYSKNHWIITNTIDFLVDFVGDNKNRIEAVCNIISELIENFKDKPNRECLYELRAIKNIMLHTPLEQRRQELEKIPKKIVCLYIYLYDSTPDFIEDVLDECDGKYLFEYSYEDDIVYIFEIE